MTKSSNRKRTFTPVFTCKRRDPQVRKIKAYIPSTEKKEKLHNPGNETAISLIKKTCKNIKYIQFKDGSITACFYKNNLPYVTENFEDCKIVLKTRPRKMFDISKMKDFSHEDMEADVHQCASVR